MSGRFVRASKYRHVHGEAAKADQSFTGLQRVLQKGDGNFVEANGTFVAVPLDGGGGPVLIFNRDKPERVGASPPCVNVHKSSVLDLSFSPFLDNVIAMASDDLRVSVTVLPEGGLEGNLTLADERTTVFEGHQKKATQVLFNPVTNILASASADNTVKLWDLVNGEEALSVACHDDLVADIAWNANGSRLASTCKDKKLRIIDPRAGEAVSVTECFGGNKSSKCFWIDNHDLLGAVGFTKRAQRSYSIFDPRKMDEPLFNKEIDSASGLMLPHYDPDTSVLYISGKGDATIRYFEVLPEGVFALSEFRDRESTKGVGWLPKRHCDTAKCEVAVAYRLLRDAVVPTSFIVPRKSDLFQEDIFPDTYAGVPTLKPNEWLEGKDADPATVSMKPGSRPAAGGAAVAAAVPAKSRSQLNTELEEAKATIEELRAEIAKLKGE